MITLTLLTLIAAAGAATLARAFKGAPEGYEDRDGFHRVAARIPEQAIAIAATVDYRRRGSDRAA